MQRLKRRLRRTGSPLYDFFQYPRNKIALTKRPQAVKKWLKVKASKLRKKVGKLRPKIMTGIRVFHNMEWATIKPLVEAIVGKEGSSSKIWLKTANEQTKALWAALPAEKKQEYTDIAQSINAGEASKEVKAK